jgi:hypothetical protein
MSRTSIWIFLCQDHNKLASVDHESLASTRRWSQWLFFSCGLAIFASVGGFLLIGKALVPSSHASIGLLTLGFSVAALGLVIGAAFFSWASEELEPLSKRQSLCVEALACANGSAAASAWRDRALASGRELRRFDLREMKYLLEAEQGAKACRQLHRVQP